jgi:hypothetical protein
MRTRTRYTGPTDVACVNYTQQHYNPPNILVDTTTIGVGTHKVQADYSVETITDDPSPGRGVKVVTHTRKRIQAFRMDTFDDTIVPNRYVGNGVNAWYDSWGSFGGGSYPRIIGMDFANVSTSYSMTDAQLIAKAKHAFYNETEVEGLLNLVESPELFTPLRGFTSRRYWSELLRHTLGDKAISHKNLLRISNGFLYWSFGVAPLISDMKKVQSALKTIQSKMRQNLLHRGTNQSSHTTMKGSFGALNYSGTVGGGIDADLNTWWKGRINILFPPTKIVSVRGIRSHKYNTDAFNKLDYLLTRFGSAGPASYIWERIPFSFVVDWFVDLSGVIDALDQFSTGNSRSIADISISEKWSLSISQLHKQYLTYACSTYGNEFARTQLDYYNRQPVTSSPLVTSTSRFGKYQFAISAALVHQLVANLKR